MAVTSRWQKSPAGRPEDWYPSLHPSQNPYLMRRKIHKAAIKKRRAISKREGGMKKALVAGPRPGGSGHGLCPAGRGQGCVEDRQSRSGGDADHPHRCWGRDRHLRQGRDRRADLKFRRRRAASGDGTGQHRYRRRCRPGAYAHRQGLLRARDLRLLSLDALHRYRGTGGPARPARR